MTTDLANEQKIEQMFLSEYERPIDPKGRITLPASHRDAMGTEGAILTRGLDRCLFLFTRSQFETWREKIRSLPVADEKSRMLRRHLFSGASDATPDAQGRITLPPFLRDYAGLDGVVIVAGVDTYIEIWNKERWAAMHSRFETSGDDAAWWNELGF